MNRCAMWCPAGSATAAMHDGCGRGACCRLSPCQTRSHVATTIDHRVGTLQRSRRLNCSTYSSPGLVEKLLEGFDAWHARSVGC